MLGIIAAPNEGLFESCLFQLGQNLVPELGHGFHCAMANFFGFKFLEGFGRSNPVHLLHRLVLRCSICSRVLQCLRSLCCALFRCFGAVPRQPLKRDAICKPAVHNTALHTQSDTLKKVLTELKQTLFST